MATMTSEERLEEFKKVYQENDVTLKGADIGVVMAYFVIIIGIGIFVSNRALSFLSFINESFNFFLLEVHLIYTTTTQLAIKQYAPMKHLNISCKKHKIDSLLFSSRCMTNDMKSCSFLHAHFFE